MIRIIIHKVRGLGLERHESAAGIDGRGLAVSIALFALAAHADARGLAGIPIVHEDIGLPVRIIGHKIGRLTCERYEMSVGIDAGGTAVAISFDSVARHTYSGRLTGCAVVDENVLFPFGVREDEVFRLRMKGNESTVGADRRMATVLVPYRAAARDAYHGRLTRVPVVDEDLLFPVRALRERDWKLWTRKRRSDRPR